MSIAEIILLVEDDPDDAELTLRALGEARVQPRVVHVRDGVQALDYLLCRGAHVARAGIERPVLMLLDLKLPRVGGIEVLREVRANEATKHLPVVILTSSSEDRDRLAAYDHHANSYIRKPVDYDQLVVAARQLGLYWLVLNLPAPPTRS